MVDVLKCRLELLIEGLFISVDAIISRCVTLYDGQVSLPTLKSCLNNPAVYWVISTCIGCVKNISMLNRKFYRQSRLKINSIFS